MKRTAKVHEEEEEEEEEEGRGIWDCGSPLYDSYELVSLSSIIDRNLMKLPSFRRSRRVSATVASQLSCQSEVSESSRSWFSGRNSNSLSTSSSMEPGKKKKEKRKKGCKNMLFGFCRRILLLKKDANGNE